MTDPSNPARTRATAWVGVVVALAAPLALAFPAGSPARGLGILLFVATGVGAGVMSWLDAGDDVFQAGLVLIVSLVGFVLPATLMIWLAAWHPALLVVLAAPVAASCLVRLRRRHTTPIEVTA